jgi:hypothetical protein
LRLLREDLGILLIEKYKLSQKAGGPLEWDYAVALGKEKAQNENTSDAFLLRVVEIIHLLNKENKKI